MIALLGGCGTGGSGSTTQPAMPAARIVRGSLHGGQQPVSGAQIQLYAVGTTGIGSASTPLISQSVQTGTSGEFDITGLWNCSNSAAYGPDPLLYIVATGGNPGLSPGTRNGTLAMMAALGRCSTLTPQTFISINEVTTVAAVYSLAGFMTDATHVGASNSTALSNAFATSRTLVDTATGLAPGPGSPAGAAIPIATLYTVADILASCINSDGAGQTCAQLFAATTVAGLVPADTIGATLAMAHEPAANVAALYALTPPAGPFQPNLPAAPKDWTLAVRFTGGGLLGPAGIAADASGNVWIANSGGSSITGLSNSGARLTGDAGESAGGTIFGAQGIAVDRGGNVWVADSLLSTVVRLAVSSGTVTGHTTFDIGFDGPVGIAVDSQSHVWVANYGGSSVTVLDGASGNLLYGSPLSAGNTLQAPIGVALDTAGNAWITDNAANNVAAFSATGNLVSGVGYTDNALVAPLGIAVKAGGEAFVAGNGSNALHLLTASGPDSASPVTGDAFLAASGLALDGGGTAWLTSSTATGSLIRVTADNAAIALGSLNTPAGVAVDASGNVWTANTGDDSVTKFVGLARPAVTPLSAAVGP